MGEVISMSKARRDRAIKRAEEKVRKEEERNRARMNQPAPYGGKLAKALSEFGSFTGKQMRKKDDGDV